ncbi:acetylornithine deacetylase [Chitinophaga terrae (ex Kim and Jung 2007)]|uniref:Acetylornithine deacetylase n=1 Tax=Chitinophaga terrae (ex Kim and Jung 2007) TaxID=408074 RepID=A0A1H4E2C2_9BACT|nr:M20 family metallo-hydrolase [Chitinophaga terrae (ex Kim and Jung 2007)]MDQ0108249.1 acetylornithine deacetylase [Chitinophaga terrae (ex Kim and Jung 2007)]GEP91446.1 acetylornithine deacetylase [Chitinophaga terrae (ex Kim and Jung 2007)]SEA79175.1 acetylornithine deacetylase [Chitinophaga terrae (ex Kim and Jung 2007)]
MWNEKLYDVAVALLKQMIATPSLSREEADTAQLISEFLTAMDIPHERHLNNIWAYNKHYDPAKPNILLNSHHDTVKPNPQYTRDPFSPDVEDGKLYGLGSNDAGGCLVSLIATFLHFYQRTDLNYNIILSATAEEEISGQNGVESILSKLPAIEFAIVGEPTLTQLAIAEKGLMVLDCTSTGKAGHAAREEGENALYKALPDLNWFKDYRFPKVSPTLGPVKMSVTVINTSNKAHNVVPADCTFVVDVRATDQYTLEEILETIKANVSCEVKPRSMRMRPSFIPMDHPFVQAGLAVGKTCYGSPTTSDQALIPATSVKMGPGDSARSHTADEFIYLHEIKEGIDSYIRLLEMIQ